MLLTWSSYCITIWGWRKLLLSTGLGALSVLALPPINLFFVLFFTLPSLIWLLDGALETSLKAQADLKNKFIKRLFTKLYAARSAFLVGLTFGFGYFFVGLLWIGEAFLVEEKFIYLLPFAVTLMPLLLATFWGLACFFARVFWTSAIKNVLILTIFLSFFEYLRGHIFTGFPWNLLGFAFDFSTAMLQSASIWGVYGLTFMVILLSSAFSLLINTRFKFKTVASSLALIFFVIWAGGAIRLYYNPTQFHDDILLRLVQGNIAQKDKWRAEMRPVIANRYLELSARKLSAENLGLSKITHLIWPEAAMPFLLKPESSFMRQVTSLLNKDAYLITGATRRQGNGDSATFYNSILAFDSQGNQLGKYDKHHLVPFGEYLPYSNLLKKIGLNKLIPMEGEFSKGKKAANIYLKNTPPFAANICFEIIFSAKVVDRKYRPEWILNVTNDGWFGETIGPHQHLAQARMRAIEEGLPTVRVANTGYTAIFDPLGRKIAHLAKGKADVLDSQLPLKVEPTIFVILTSFL